MYREIKKENEEKLVVMDSHIPELDGNRLFVSELAKKVSHTILPTCYLFREAAAAGIRFVTIDVYLKMEPKPRALLISHLGSDCRYILNKFSNCVRPVILTCQESPFIATHFYIGLPFISKKFKYSFVFSGMKKMIGGGSIYRQMFFPEPYGLKDFTPKNFKDKKLITMVSGAKSISNWKKNILLKLMYGFSVREIYPERLKAVEYFSNKDGFDLYGRGWDGLNLIKRHINKFYKGTIEDKFATIRNYKFTICFENSIFPGYVTEKIFDAIFAGSVPIYYGAPDIIEYIPAKAFIDFRNFKNYDELYSYISSISEEKYNSYLCAMKDFISSEAYQRFSQENFSREIINILEKEFKQ
jgi:hypothetical protein